MTRLEITDRTHGTAVTLDCKRCPNGLQRRIIYHIEALHVMRIKDEEEELAYGVRCPKKERDTHLFCVPDNPIQSKQKIARCARVRIPKNPGLTKLHQNQKKERKKNWFEPNNS